MHCYPCRKAGCKSLVTTPGYCIQHQGAQRYGVTLRSNAALEAYDWDKTSSWHKGYDSNWAKARVVFLTEHPLCEACGKAATLVDHIIPHKGDKALFWDTDNWQALCKNCHAVKSRKEYFEQVRGRHSVTWNGYVV